MQKHLRCMSKRTLGVKNIHTIEITYVNDNDFKYNIYR